MGGHVKTSLILCRWPSVEASSGIQTFVYYFTASKRVLASRLSFIISQRRSEFWHPDFRLLFHSVEASSGIQTFVYYFTASKRVLAFRLSFIISQRRSEFWHSM